MLIILLQKKVWEWKLHVSVPPASPCPRLEHLKNGQPTSVFLIPHKIRFISPVQKRYDLFHKTHFYFEKKNATNLPLFLNFDPSKKVVLNWILTLESDLYRNTARQETCSVWITSSATVLTCKYGEKWLSASHGNNRSNLFHNWLQRNSFYL